MKKIKRAYKFRITPTQEQLAMLLQWVGNTRFVYNLLLRKNMDQYKEDGTFILAHQMTTSLPLLKEEYSFLKLSPSQSLQFVARCLDKALKDSFGKNKGFPRFKSKRKQRDSLTIFQAFSVEKQAIKVPKLGHISLKKHRAIYVSLIGVDMGIKTFVACSDGTIVANPRILTTYQEQLAFQQKLLSKKKIGSRNREKQKKKVRKIYNKITNTRKDFQHKVSHDMITKYDGVMLEDLHISGMIKNKKLAKHIADASWHEFVRMLEYKAQWQDKVYITIGRFEPTSKTCSACGWVDAELCLSDRIFECQICSLVLDRDLNAALNIRNKGLEKLPRDARDVKPVELVSLQTTKSVAGCESGIKEC